MRQHLSSMEDVRQLWRGKNVRFERQHIEDFKYVVHVIDRKTKKEVASYYIYSLTKLSRLR